MSGENSSSSKAGLIGAAIAGGALLGAACYAAYETYKTSDWFHRDNTFSQRQPASFEEQSCVFCRKNLEAEESIELPCVHCFHKACLQAHHILYLDRDEAYKCIVCKVTVPEIILQSLHN